MHRFGDMKIIYQFNRFKDFFGNSLEIIFISSEYVAKLYLFDHRLLYSIWLSTCILKDIFHWKNFYSNLSNWILNWCNESCLWKISFEFKVNVNISFSTREIWNYYISFFFGSFTRYKAIVYHVWKLTCSCFSCLYHTRIWNTSNSHLCTKQTLKNVVFVIKSTEMAFQQKKIYETTVWNNCRRYQISKYIRYHLGGS